MRYAIIANSKVINVAISDTPLAANWIASETAAIGDTYENGQFIKPPPPPPQIPQAITRRQAKQQLLIAGLLDQVQPALDAIENETERAMMQIYWDDSQEFYREHPQLIALATGPLGLTESQLDELFISAGAL